MIVSSDISQPVPSAEKASRGDIGTKLSRNAKKKLKRAVKVSSDQLPVYVSHVCNDEIRDVYKRVYRKSYKVWREECQMGGSK